MSEQVYLFRWKSPVDRYGNRTKWPEMYGRHCRMLVHGGMNNRLVEFLDDGQREIVNGNAIRKIKSI